MSTVQVGIEVQGGREKAMAQFAPQSSQLARTNPQARMPAFEVGAHLFLDHGMVVGARTFRLAGAGGRVVDSTTGADSNVGTMEGCRAGSGGRRIRRRWGKGLQWGRAERCPQLANPGSC